MNKLTYKTNPKNNIIIYLIIFIIIIIGLIYKGNTISNVLEYNYAFINEPKNTKINDSTSASVSISSKQNNSNFKDKINESKLNILFAGDIMTDRYIRKQINYFRNFDKSQSEAENFNNNFLGNLSEVNSKYDYVVANLEGPITKEKSVTLNDDGTYGQDLIFTFPTSTVEILKILNIGAVSLANNHTDNFYHAGYVSTKEYLEEGGINYFGNPYNNNLETKVSSDGGGEAAAKNTENLSTTVCKNNICIAYIGYNKFTTKNDVKIIEDEIKRLNPAPVGAGQEGDKLPDFIVVMPHWGEEYDLVSNNFEKDAAHRWIDAGADLIVGSHPHVIQESEIYNGKNIYYSLGNYIFDQWFSADVKKGKAIDISFMKICKDKNNFNHTDLQNNNLENKVEMKNECKNDIKINKELDVNISRDGIKYNL